MFENRGGQCSRSSVNGGENSRRQEQGVGGGKIIVRKFAANLGEVENDWGVECTSDMIFMV